MATLTPIASLAASMLQKSRLTTLAAGTIADPENSAVFRTFASGEKLLQKEIYGDQVPASAGKTGVATGSSLLPWEPRWICTDTAADT